ncbi:MAG: DNA-binding protein [Lentisphaerae bacterium]|nr:DNA-binding protein [Lentisphaerota bacterium]
MCELFQRERSVITKHIRNVFSEGECDEKNNVQILHINQRGRPIALYSLDVIISVGYRVKSLIGTCFRRWATGILKKKMLAGAQQSAQLAAIDRKLLSHERDIADLKEKVDFFVQTQTPPLQGVFYEGQLWDACSLVEKLIGRAKKEIVLIDSWVGPTTLDMLAKKRKGVMVEVVTSPRGNKLAASDITKFNAQYGGISVKTSAAFHDRFLIVDDKELYLIGASLKDLGRKCFGFTVLCKSNIPDILAKI